MLKRRRQTSRPIVVSSSRPEGDPAPRPTLLIVVLALIAAAPVAIPDGTRFDGARDLETIDAASPTTTSSPTATSQAALPPAIVASGQTVLDATALGRGPQVAWAESDLPASVTAVYEIGELHGSPALLGATTTVDERGVYPGATLFIDDGQDGWTARWSLPDALQVVAADIGPSGIIAVTAGRGAAVLPYAATDVTIHGSPDGFEWGDTTIMDAGDGWLVNINATVGADGAHGWVTAHAVEDDFAAVTELLPPSIRDLVRARSASVEVRHEWVDVVLPIGFPILRVTFEELGLASAPTRSSVPRVARAWTSADHVSFEFEPQPPAGSEIVTAMTRGADGRLLALDIHRNIMRTTPEGRWEEVGRLSDFGFGVTSIQSIEDKVLAIHGRRIEVLSGGSGEFILSPPAGRGVSPYVLPAGDAGGVAVATAADGPQYSVTVDPAEIRRRDKTLIVEPAEHRITVRYDDGSVETFASPEDDHRVTFDPSTSRLYLGGAAVWITVDEIERAYLAGLRANARGPYGVAFTRDGANWGWAPTLDKHGREIGPIARLATGENRIYAVIDQPHLPNTPLTASRIRPRLLVGEVGR